MSPMSMCTFNINCKYIGLSLVIVSLKLFKNLNLLYTSIFPNSLQEVEEEGEDEWDEEGENDVKEDDAFMETNPGQQGQPDGEGKGSKRIEGDGDTIEEKPQETKFQEMEDPTPKASSPPQTKQPSAEQPAAPGQNSNAGTSPEVSAVPPSSTEDTPKAGSATGNLASDEARAPDAFAP